jgi:hypothetical protein
MTEQTLLIILLSSLLVLYFMAFALDEFDRAK